MTVAVLMAGGRSERMAASGRLEHKALVPALEVPLVERTLCQLLKAGLTDIFVASNTSEASIRAYVDGPGSDLAASQGATLSHFAETERLGTAGAAVQLARGEDVLSIFVDNLSTIDLQAMLAHHSLTGAAMTIATHLEAFQLPFGEVDIRDGRLVAYREKPKHEFPICSGIFVVTRKALDLVATRQRIDLPEVANGLAAAGHLVSEFRHQAQWIDVNTAELLGKAEDMIRCSPAEFELWARQPDRSAVAFLAISDGCVLLAKSDDKLSLPHTLVQSAEQPEDALARLLQDIGDIVPSQDLTEGIALDECDRETGLVTRFHVFRSTHSKPMSHGAELGWHVMATSDRDPWTRWTRRVTGHFAFVR